MVFYYYYYYYFGGVFLLRGDQCSDVWEAGTSSQTSGWFILVQVGAEMVGKKEICRVCGKVPVAA